ncbi:MAG: hypothetical protein V2A54_08875 [Bacteroidota bacterium]
MKKIIFLLLLFLSDFLNAQNNCGNFIVEFYYIDPLMITQKKITKMIFTTKSKATGQMSKTLYLNSKGQKYKIGYKTKETGLYYNSFDSTELCDYFCPVESNADIECDNNLKTLFAKDQARNLDHFFSYDANGRLKTERWELKNGTALERNYFYNTSNLLDSTYIVTTSKGDTVNREYQKLKYLNNQLVFSGHYVVIGYGRGNYLYTCVCPVYYKYNKNGLIKKYYSRGREKMKCEIEYYSGRQKLK